jgi:hypothetical protein
LDYLKGKEEWALTIPETSLSSQSALPSSQLQPPSLLSTRSPVTTSQQQQRAVSPNPSPRHGPRPITPTPTQIDLATLVNVPQNNALLGRVIANLFSLALPHDPPPPPPCMPSFPIRACILGKHLAGKSAVLQKLSEAYRITVISVDQLVMNTIEYVSSLSLFHFPHL